MILTTTSYQIIMMTLWTTTFTVIQTASAWTLSAFSTRHHHPFTPSSSQQSTTSLSMAIGIPIGKNYKPKWKKIKTLVEKEQLEGQGTLPQDKGLSGTIQVQFQSIPTSSTSDEQGTETVPVLSTITTLANPGDPIRDVASQAGQYIKYGCGKGQCGTCQVKCLNTGQFIKPCVDVIPITIQPNSEEEYVLQVKQTKNKSLSSGKFYSIRSIIMGFWNNLLGMIGMVITRKDAKKNYQERMEYEDKVAQMVRERKRQKEQRKQ